MKNEDVESLMKMMVKDGVRKIAIKHKDGSEIMIDRGSDVEYAPIRPQIHAPAHLNAPSSPVVAAEAAPSPKATGNEITSPMVGTFYSAPSADKPAFINVGDTVKKGQQIGIIEAMKVMNEVKADRDGTVVEILVRNEQPVEFGTLLVRLS